MEKISNGSINTSLTNVLLAYCTTPQLTTGLTPAEMLLGCKPRTHLDLLKPHTAEQVERKQNYRRLHMILNSKFAHLTLEILSMSRILEMVATGSLD